MADSQIWQLGLVDNTWITVIITQSRFGHTVCHDKVIAV